MARNGITNVALAPLSAEDFSDAFAGKRYFERLKGVDLSALDIRCVLVDPPRAGCGPDVMKILQQFQSIVYISCNPVRRAGGHLLIGLLGRDAERCPRLRDCSQSLRQACQSHSSSAAAACRQRTGRSRSAPAPRLTSSPLSSATPVHSASARPLSQATMAADMAGLGDSHRIAKFAVFDQFPYTPHAECGALLLATGLPGTDPVVVAADAAAARAAWAVAERAVAAVSAWKGAEATAAANRVAAAGGAPPPAAATAEAVRE